MIEIILLFGLMGIIGLGFMLSAVMYYPFDRSRNSTTLKEYLKEMF